VELSNKIALITGGASGIGAATARAMAAEGAELILLDRAPDRLEQVADTIRAGGTRVTTLAADIGDEAQMQGAFSRIASQHGRLDVVFANAGINGVWAPIDDLKPEEFDKTIAVNLRGTYLTLHLTVPHLKMQGAGSIVVVSSINGNRTFTTPGATAYTATKAAQVAMVQQLALELGKHHIRVNAVCPGEIETNIGENTNLRHEEETAIPVEWPEGQVPISDGRPGKSEDVAEVIAFLASERSRHVTGTPIYVDGGQGLLR